LDKNKRSGAKLEKLEPDEFDWAGLGYTIHNIYNCMENYLLRIAKFFENSLDPIEWHRDLIHRMTLEIEGVRPAFLARELEPRIQDLRAFRHIFRNIYQSSLDVEKLKLLNGRVPDAVSSFKTCHESSIAKLHDIVSEIENG
jgi:hypothetical protein